MDIQYRNQCYEVEDKNLFVRESGFYARIEVAGSRVPMVAYIKVTPPVAQAFDSGMDYCYPQPDPCTMDNIIALTEILNTRDPERQKSRDLYTYQLYCEIADVLAA